MGSPGGLRRPAVSTLDSNTEGPRGRSRPFSTADRGPAAAPQLPEAEMPGQSWVFRAGGQIASLRTGSHRDSLKEKA